MANSLVAINRPIHVVLDLDNTIIDYSKSFSIACEMVLNKKIKEGTKDYYKKILKNESESAWQKFQALVYGKLIDYAEIDPYAIKLLSLLEKQGVSYRIVSHKTKKSHQLNLSLQKITLRFLKKKLPLEIYKSVISKTIFTESLQEKNQIIKFFSPLIIIDDLYDVLRSANESSFKIHFSSTARQMPGIVSTNSWRHIYFSLMLVLRHFPVENMRFVRALNKAQTTWLVEIGSSRFVLKYYKRPKRCLHESKVLSLRLEGESFFFPKMFCKNKHGIISEYIEKTKSIGHKELFAAIVDLNKVSRLIKNRSKLIPDDSRRTLKDYYINIKTRALELDVLLPSPEGDILSYILLLNEQLCDLYRPVLLNENNRKSTKFFSNFDISIDNFIEHNGRVCFIDNESTGFDDVSRLLANLIIHPCNQASAEVVNATFLKLFRMSCLRDENFSIRFYNQFVFVFLEWQIIKMSSLNPTRNKQLVFTKKLSKTKINNIINNLTLLEKLIDRHKKSKKRIFKELLRGQA